MSNVCFGFGMQILQSWVPCSLCVLILECKYCKVESQVLCVKGWYVGIVGLGPMSIVDLSNWHVDIISGTFTFLMLLLV
jgi:hypothetical protein